MAISSVITEGLRLTLHTPIGLPEAPTTGEAKKTVATFKAAGDYTLQATITKPGYPSISVQQPVAFMHWKTDYPMWRRRSSRPVTAAGRGYALGWNMSATAFQVESGCLR